MLGLRDSPYKPHLDITLTANGTSIETKLYLHQPINHDWPHLYVDFNLISHIFYRYATHVAGIHEYQFLVQNLVSQS